MPTDFSASQLIFSIAPNQKFDWTTKVQCSPNFSQKNAESNFIASVNIFLQYSYDYFMHFIFVFSISLGKLFPDLREALQVTRGKFEELISPLLMRTISLVKLALAESGFKPNEIDEAIFSISKFCIICYANISTFCFYAFHFRFQHLFGETPL